MNTRAATPIAEEIASPALAAQLQARDAKDRWEVPVELALALTTSVMADVARKRRARGAALKPTAVVFRRDDWLFAVVEFYGPGRQALLFRLNDVFLWENKPWAAR